MPDPKTNLELVAMTVQVVSVVVGVVISVFSFNATRIKEAEVRKIEAERPFKELQRSKYLEAIKVAAAIATPDGRTEEEMIGHRRRFRELYIAELAMVEDPGVEEKMVALARAVDPELLNLNPAQTAALNLAHALSKTYSSHQHLAK